MRTYSPRGAAWAVMGVIANTPYSYGDMKRAVQFVHPELSGTKCKKKIYHVLKALREDGLVRRGELTDGGWDALETLDTREYTV